MMQTPQYVYKDLSQLPPPLVYEKLDYEALLARKAAVFNSQHPLVFDQGQPVFVQADLVDSGTEKFWKVPLDASAGLYYLNLESDPATRHIEADTYHELLLRQRVNEAALSTLPSFAFGADLDHIGVRYFDTRRHLISEATDDAPAVYESDAAYLKRILLSPEGQAKGGSVGWYEYHALSADARVKGVLPLSPEPCHVHVTILSHEGSGHASEELCAVVHDALSQHYFFPQGDRLTVSSAEIVEYELKVQVQMYPGPSSATVFEQIDAAVAGYRAESERIGHQADLDGWYSALRQPGVYHVEIVEPAVWPVAGGVNQAPFCTNVDIEEVAA